ncbi:LLM class flavin-dependent oxidoreductase [Winogradskya humida]|uniref:Alkanesulfonate monooxygenase n=1 Tax=Winogradskya humida TaxID=113566 RepID=A0ABQ3ZYF7_9ACTN|nr:LLM class flavin-dependent oxidoreductase [Actinoplanes humidus]GIE23583.1 alkanesulfonate monooxygenase [Actinoplanes humidus]
MPVEFLGTGAINDGSEIRDRSGALMDPEYTIRLARAHEDFGYDRVLVPYWTSAPDPTMVAGLIAANTRSLGLVVAHRPNVCHPTYAAKMFATLDQISGGRATVHFITGGVQSEQQREGDYLNKDQRYARTREYMGIVKRAWTTREPFDHDGEHYRFTGFQNDVVPVSARGPEVSFGGSSPAAYSAGGAEADIYALWAESLEGTAAQIASIRAAAKAAGRTDSPRIQIGFRPIIAATEDLAWKKAHDIVERLYARRDPDHKAENAGTQRLLALAGKGERHDRALWTATAVATGGSGDTTALVGTPDTVAAAILDYIDLGVDIIAARGYDWLGDAIDFGRYVIPSVREELAKRTVEETANV